MLLVKKEVEIGSKLMDSVLLTDLSHLHSIENVPSTTCEVSAFLVCVCVCVHMSVCQRFSPRFEMPVKYHM